MASTFMEAIEASKIVANKSMRKHGRKTWHEEDIAAGHRAFVELWDMKLNQPRCPTVVNTTRRIQPVPTLEAVGVLVLKGAA